MKRMGMPVWAWVAVWAAATLPQAEADMSPANKFVWGENIGWVNLAPTHGGVLVRYDGSVGYLAGLAWGENVGWLKMGSDAGGPYGNTSASDWGVNMAGDGTLSGYAWGENIGWINFGPAHGGVTVDLATGQFAGLAWGENIGWINFSIAAEKDSDGDGIPDWWETLHFGGPTSAVAASLAANGRNTLLECYIADLDPTEADSYFRIVAISNAPPDAVDVVATTSARRLYTLQRRDSLTGDDWTNVAGQADVPGAAGTSALRDGAAAGAARFYRVRVRLP